MTTTNTAAVETMRAAIGQLLNEFGERQWQSGRGVPHKSLEEAFDAIIERAALAAPVQAATAKQSPHPEYDKGFSDGWNRCEERQAAAPAQAGEYPPSSADMVMAALDTEEWGLERMQHWHCLTDEGNREGAWLVKRQKAPYCAVYTDKPGEPYGPRSWSGPTALDALQKAADDLGIRLPQPAARGAAQAAPVDAAVQRESQYNRGFRHGYNRRDAEVKGALA